MNKNQFSKSIIFTILFIGNWLVGFAQNPLFIPPILEGDEIDLNIMASSHQFVQGLQTPTWGFNGSYLGPTLVLEKGAYVQFNITNLVNENTTVHWHGLNVPPSADGGATAHHHIHPGETISPGFEILDRAGTYWYHPHPHEHTEAHVVRGLAGMMIIKDDEEAALELPRTYGVDDFPLIIQDKTFDTTQVATDSIMPIVETGLSHIMLTNGTIDPILEAPAQVVRFRALNASAARHYMLGWSDTTDLIQIASDGGLLESPLILPRIMLSPGERAEFVIDLSGREGDTLSLMSFAPEMPEGAAGQGIVIAPGLPGENSPLNGAVFPILKVAVGSPTADPVTTLPPSPLAILPSMPDITGLGVTRTLTMLSPNNGAGGPFNFDGEYYDIDVMNQIVPLGQTEIWLIRNQTLIGHPFHLHGGSYYMLERNGAAPAENELGLKDVWHVERGGFIKIVVRFDTYSDNEVPFMYHCHMLGHEDGGLMGNVLVVDSTFTSTTENTAYDLDYSLYPNPTNGVFNIEILLNSTSDVTVEVFSLTGQCMIKSTEKANGYFKKTMDMTQYPSGIWLVKLTIDGFSTTQKVVLIN